MATRFFYEDGTIYEGYYGHAPHYSGGKKILHREDGPAVIWLNGSEEWYKDGKLHRLDGPARMESGETKRFYVNGSLISGFIYEKVRNVDMKEDLIILLLDNDTNIRVLAEYRLKELENENQS